MGSDRFDAGSHHGRGIAQADGPLLACGEVQHQQLSIIQMIVERAIPVLDMQRGQRSITQEGGQDFTYMGTWKVQALLLQVQGSRISGGTKIKAHQYASITAWCAERFVAFQTAGIPEIKGAVLGETGYSHACFKSFRTWAGALLTAYHTASARDRSHLPRTGHEL
ncbi:hypothetical protein D3C81_1276280 [compost metagenome]